MSDLSAMDLYTVFIGILWTASTVVRATDEHVVFAGSCVTKPDNFCGQQVDNSVCNTEKNECFCKRGYVAIREEEDRVSCKTLLTDLKCRMDRDCRHVNRSTCHPGAGFCSCPGHTVYTPELHACRAKAYQIENNQFCRKCQHEAGVCFVYENHDTKEKYFKVDQEYLGCACPSSKSSLGVETRNKLELCNDNLVDIGDYCSEYRDKCRAKSASCTDRRHRSSQMKTCQCPEKHVRVYQTNLHYYECFPVLSQSAPQCGICVASGRGLCYDLNEDGMGDGCACPPLFSSPREVSPLSGTLSASAAPAAASGASSVDFRNQHEFCTVKHVDFSCTGADDRLTLCYLPHWRPPYESLQSALVKGHALVRLLGSGGDSGTSETCVLRYDPAQRRFCTNIDLVDQIRECGIRSYRIAHRKLQYEFILEILNNRSFKDPSKDMQFPLSCVAKEPQKKIRKPPPTRRDEKSRKPPIVPSSPPDRFNLDLQILDGRNNEVNAVEEGSLIKLDASLIDPSGNYKAISVEQCYFSNDTRTTVYNSPGSTSVLLIYKGCPVIREGFMANFRSSLMPGIHLQSDGFLAFQLGRSGLDDAGSPRSQKRLYIDCFIRVCKEEQFCWQMDCRKSSSTQVSLQTIENRAAYSVVHRRAGISVIGKQKLSNPREQARPDSRQRCAYAVCLTALQTAVMAGLLVLLVLLILVIMLIIYRKNRLYQQQQQQHARPPKSQTAAATASTLYPVRHRCLPDPGSGGALYLSRESQSSPLHKLQLVNDNYNDTIDTLPIIYTSPSSHQHQHNQHQHNQHQHQHHQHQHSPHYLSYTLSHSHPHHISSPQPPTSEPQTTATLTPSTSESPTRAGNTTTITRV